MDYTLNFRTLSKSQAHKHTDPAVHLQDWLTLRGLFCREGDGFSRVKNQSSLCLRQLWCTERGVTPHNKVFSRLLRDEWEDDVQPQHFWNYKLKRLHFVLLKLGRAFVALILTVCSALKVLDDRAFSSTAIRAHKQLITDHERSTTAQYLQCLQSSKIFLCYIIFCKLFSETYTNSIHLFSSIC